MAMTRSHPRNAVPRTRERGFALLVAVIFMSVMLTLGLALGSIAYKQEVLASGAIESQYAFYVADAALECGLYADQQQDLFDYSAHSANTPPSLITSVACADSSGPATQLSYSYTSSALIVVQRLPFDQGQRCADVSVYKYVSPSPITYVFSQGYDVPCATVAAGNARFVARGVNAHYASTANSVGTIVSFATPGTSSWTVPSGVHSITVEAWGGGGGGGGGGALTVGGAGGGGGFAQATLAVNPGQSLTVLVGGGGGPGGYISPYSGTGGGGGGYTAIKNGGTELVTAAGGAGGGGGDNTGASSAGGAGGAGGGTTGVSGTSSAGPNPGTSATGGSSSAGGVAGAMGGTNGAPLTGGHGGSGGSGTDGTAGTGGTNGGGIGGQGSLSLGRGGGGGGGAGHYGGGGGGGPQGADTGGGGGGGGSSYTTGTNTNNIAGSGQAAANTGVPDYNGTAGVGGGGGAVGGSGSSGAGGLLVITY